MSSARDSSVLFALDELRGMEEERNGASVRAAREQAERDRDRAAEERRRQQRSEQQSAELLALRERAEIENAERAALAARLADEGACRRALEAQLQHLRMQHKVASEHQVSAPIRKHLGLWSTALLGVSALLFWLIPTQAALAPRPVVAESSPVAIEAPAVTCPDFVSVEASPPTPTELGRPTRTARATPPRRPGKTREKVPPRPVQSASSLPVDCAGKGPLCGMPED